MQSSCASQLSLILSNRSIPRFHVIPELAYPDIGEAIEWLNRAFGLTLRIRIANYRAQLNCGDGAVVLIEPDAGVGARSALLVRVEDVGAHHLCAHRNGARILREPSEHVYGERRYSAEDFAGHIWTFSQSIADVAPETWGGTTGEL
jgi:uncharacterized glyoxalase superfamily protein PhnB